MYNPVLSFARLSSVQLQLREREVELAGQLKEKDLTIEKLEEDGQQLAGQVKELDGMRERAAEAEKMRLGSFPMLFEGEKLRFQA